MIPIRLLGSWSLTRSVSDGSRLVGQAAFERLTPESLDYHEQGILTLANGESFEAFRRYVFQETASGFSVWFAESPLRLFHEIVLQPEDSKEIVLQPEDSGWRGEAEHLCGADLYRSRYHFTGPDSFSIEHRVDGPRKGYTMVTHYNRERDIG